MRSVFSVTAYVVALRGVSGGRAPLRSGGGELGRRDEQLGCESSPSMAVGERRCGAAAASSGGETRGLAASRARVWRWASAAAERRRRAREARRGAWLRVEPEYGGGRAPLRSGGGELGRRDEGLGCESSPSMAVGERRCGAAVASSGGETRGLAASRARVWRWASAGAERRWRAREARRGAWLRVEPEYGGGRAPVRSGGGELGRRDEGLGCESSPSMAVGERRCGAAVASSGGETRGLSASRARGCGGTRTGPVVS